MISVFTHNLLCNKVCGAFSPTKNYPLFGAITKPKALQSDQNGSYKNRLIVQSLTQAAPVREVFKILDPKSPSESVVLL